jgi:hypothetical protein
MARDIEAPPSADDRMSRRAPKDKKKDLIVDKLKEAMDRSREEARKDMTFEEKFKTANTKERKMMMAKGGSVKESKMMKKKGRNMTKAAMQKEATKAVRKHEKAMHGMKEGGSVSKRADGIAQRGKTKCKMA